MCEAIYRQWAHSPSHLFAPNSSYFITAGTYDKKLLFDTASKKEMLLRALFEAMEKWKWELEAWAVMSNHYHLIARAPDDAKTLKRMITELHSKTAIELNRMDGVSGRKVWFQYRDTCLTNERSYYARLHYVKYNPVKHGLTANALNYKWCSMAWFMQNARPGFRRTVLSFPIDSVQVEDDF